MSFLEDVDEDSLFGGETNGRGKLNHVKNHTPSKNLGSDHEASSDESNSDSEHEGGEKSSSSGGDNDSDGEMAGEKESKADTLQLHMDDSSLAAAVLEGADVKNSTRLLQENILFH